MLPLASNISFLVHPALTTDPSLDPPSKKRLGVHFHNPRVKVFNVLFTAGKTGLRLFVCSEDTVEKIKIVRKVVDKMLQERLTSVERRKWDI